MGESLENYNDTFEYGHPCAECITKGMCKRLRGEAGNNFCDLPEQFEFWQLEKEIKEYENAAKKGDKQSIEELANISKDLLKFKKKAFDAGLEFVKKMKEEFTKNTNK